MILKIHLDLNEIILRVGLSLHRVIVLGLWLLPNLEVCLLLLQECAILAHCFFQVVLTIFLINIGCPFNLRICS